MYEFPEIIDDNFLWQNEKTYLSIPGTFCPCEVETSKVGKKVDKSYFVEYNYFRWEGEGAVVMFHCKSPF